MIKLFILLIILAVMLFALYSYFANDSDIDDRSDGWKIFGPTSGPFHWLKPWMMVDKPYEEQKDLYMSMKAADTSNLDKAFDNLEQMSQDVSQGMNIRAKQVLDDWDDIKIIHYAQTITITVDARAQGFVTVTNNSSKSPQISRPLDKHIIDKILELIENA